MTDFERYKYILDTTGVDYEEFICEVEMSLEISPNYISTYEILTIAFDKNGKFKFFEIGE